MPNIKSAKKRMRVSARQAIRNKMLRSKLRTNIKKADIAIADNKDAKDATVKATIRAIDKAVNKGVLHKNTAARRKSRITLAANKAS